MKSKMKEVFLDKFVQCKCFIENRYKGKDKADLNDESGVTMIEYVLIAALVSGILVTFFQTFETDLSSAWSRVRSALQS